MAYFAGYGFNKSHSAAYGMISYQTGWLKAQYKPEYMAALMSIECGNTDKVNVFIKDCKNPKKDRDRNYAPEKIEINLSLMSIKATGNFTFQREQQIFVLVLVQSRVQGKMPSSR